MNQEQISDIIKAGDLGALGDEGEPIGDALAEMWLVWAPPDSEIEVPDYLGEQLEAALAEQNAAYDESGYVLDAPRAHDAKFLVCGIIDDITAAIREPTAAMLRDGFERRSRLIAESMDINERRHGRVK